MKIDEFLKKECLKQEVFAEKIGVTQGALSRYVNGVRLPPPSIMRAIYVATRGVVTPNDFYGLPDGSVWFANPPEIDRTEGDDDDVRSL